MSLNYNYNDDEEVCSYSIPSLNLIPDAFVFLSSLYDAILRCKYRVIYLHFDECNFISPSFLPFLGGLRSHFESKGISIRFSPPDKNGKIFKYFVSSGFYTFYTNKLSRKNENALLFNRIDIISEKQLLEYLEKTLDLMPVKLSPRLSQMVFQNICEIFFNAIEHSDAMHGVYSCGHWFPNKREFVFSIYDTGIGIPNKIQTVFKNFKSHEALHWALQKGHSTLQLLQGSPRGLGLYTLIQFVKKNNGSLTIFSNDVYYYCSANEPQIEIMPYSIPGTLISITIVADDLHVYATKGELPWK